MKNLLIVTGIAGLVASVLVGIGEYMLHFDDLARFENGGYEFMVGISQTRSTIGHFFGVLGATLYPVGCYHIYLMLRPANQALALAGFLIASFGFIVGAVWIGSRASVSALIQVSPTAEIEQLISLYDVRYETLLQIVRITTLVFSVIIVWLSVKGKSLYPRWIGLFNPIFMIVGSFILFAIVPVIGKHTMPIALNVAFFVFFMLSIVIASRHKDVKK